MFVQLALISQMDCFFCVADKPVALGKYGKKRLDKGLSFFVNSLPQAIELCVVYRECFRVKRVIELEVFEQSITLAECFLVVE